MRKVILLAIVMLALASGLAVAQCNCADPAFGEVPPCYTTFGWGQEVRFKLVAPLEYFLCCAVCETPLITGWRVETLDGVITYEEVLRAPKGHYYEISWDQKDSWRNRIPCGYYRIVIETTVGEYVNYIHVNPGCWDWCGYCCASRLHGCPCGVMLCQPYVKFLPSTTQSWSPCCCSVSVTVRLGADCSIDCDP